MPTTPFYLQQFRFLDGSPASGGKLYATVQGTETPAQLYLNPGLTTPAAQPLVLSAEGIAPQFWAPTVPGLCFKLKDPRGGVDTLVWTRDYISDGDGVNAPGTVTSVGLSLGSAMEAIADVSSSPVVTAGNLGLELADQTQGKALMSPASGTGKPAFRKVEFPKLKYAVSDPSILSPSVGDQFMVGDRGSTPVGAFAGHAGEIAEWAGSGWEFWPITGNAIMVTDSNQAFYRWYNGWYQYWSFNSNFGVPALNFFGVPLYCETVRDYSGATVWQLDGTGLNIRTGLTGTNFLSASINLSGHGNFSSVRTGTPSNPTVCTERISATGAGFLTSLDVSGETTLNGASRPLWDGGINAVVLSNDTALATHYLSPGGSWTLASNAAYSSGAYRAIDSHGLGTSPPRLLQMSTDGTLRYFTDIANAPVAGVAAVLTIKWSLSKEGDMALAGNVKQYSTEPILSSQYVKVASTTVTGVTIETSLINGGVAAGGWNAISVPAGRLNIAALLSDLKLKGTISSASNTLVTWRIRVNGAIVATNAVTRNWGASFWRIEGNGTTRTTGASGTRQWDIGLYATADNTNAGVSYYDLGWAGTLDLTAAATLDVTVQPADTSTSITCSTAYLRHS